MFSAQLICFEITEEKLCVHERDARARRQYVNFFQDEIEIYFAGTSKMLALAWGSRQPSIFKSKSC
jgi:hypothetical protein